MSALPSFLVVSPFYIPNNTGGYEATTKQKGWGFKFHVLSLIVVHAVTVIVLV